RVKGFGLAAFASRLDSDGPVENSGYRNANLALHVTRSFGRQNLALSGNFNSNEGGAPGPYGSNPKNLFTGIDAVSRDKNNFSQSLVRLQIGFLDRLRQETFASFFLNNSGFQSPFGFSFNKDLRGQAETRTVVSVTHACTVALGATFAREEVKNSFISDN